MGRKLRARSVAIAGSLMCNQRELIYDRMLANDVEEGKWREYPLGICRGSKKLSA